MGETFDNRFDLTVLFRTRLADLSTKKVKCMYRVSAWVEFRSLLIFSAAKEHIH